MKFFASLLVFTSIVAIIEPQIIELLKETNESCCSSIFPNSAKECQDEIEERLKSSYVELLYKKESEELKDTTIEVLQQKYINNVKTSCERVKKIYNNRKEKGITIHENQLGFLVAITATYDLEGQVHAFTKYVSKTPERMEAAIKLTTYYYQCLYYYDNKYATRLKYEPNFADAIFSENFQRYFLQFKGSNDASGTECGFIKACTLDQAFGIYQDDVENNTLKDEESVFNYITSYCEMVNRKVKPTRGDDNHSNTGKDDHHKGNNHRHEENENNHHEEDEDNHDNEDENHHEEDEDNHDNEDENHHEEDADDDHSPD